MRARIEELRHELRGVEAARSALNHLALDIGNEIVSLSLKECALLAEEEA